MYTQHLHSFYRSNLDMTRLRVTTTQLFSNLGVTYKYLPPAPTSAHTQRHVGRYGICNNSFSPCRLNCLELYSKGRSERAYTTQALGR